MFAPLLYWFFSKIWIMLYLLKLKWQCIR